MTIYPLKSGPHDKNAWGARFLKPGFSFTTQMDLAFALGFPHMKLVAVGHPDDADPLNSYLARWRAADPIVFPERVMRCWLKDAPTGWKYQKASEAPWTDKIEAPFSDHELSRNSSPSVSFAEHRMWMLEVLEGPESVLTRALASLENSLKEYPAWLDQAWTGISRGMGAMLLRVPEAVRTRILDALAAFAKKVPRDDAFGRFHKGIDEIFGRGENLRRSRVLHGTATPKEIVESLRSDYVREGWSPDAREALFGGNEVIGVMRDRWKEMTADAREQLVEQYGWIRSEQVVHLFADMLAAPKLKKRILEWFVDRADYARPILTDLAKKNAAARSALQHLDKAANGKPRKAENKAENKAEKKPTSKPAKKAPKKKKTARKRA